MWLTADLHLTDAPADEYRWRIFDKLVELSPQVMKHDDNELCILGDITDRKDRHSAELVNRLVGALKRLTRFGWQLTIIMGNHDMPLRGVPFWEFVNEVEAPAIRFWHKPHADGNVLFLPYSADPKKEWREIDFKLYKLIFMHQTISGVDTGDGRKLLNENMVIFPRSCRVYSGDIHNPQTIGNVTYVGAPHPVKFGDTYPCRLLRIDEETGKIVEEIMLRDGAKKLIVTATSVADLASITVAAGDQARVRFALDAAQIERWPAIESEIAAWAAKRGVALASIEAVVTGNARGTDDTVSLDYLDDAADILSAYGTHEGLDAAMLDVGFDLLRELMPANAKAP